MFIFSSLNSAIAWDTSAIGANRISKLYSFESIIEFELNVRELQESAIAKCIQSAKFKLNDVTWKIQACRNFDSSHSIDNVDMSLVSIFDGDSAAWSCEANASFKLLAMDGEESIVQSFDYYNFNADESVRTIDDFVSWDDFFEKHVEEDHAIFVITIVCRTINRAARLDESFAKFDVRINNINRLRDEYSNELIVRGMRWKVFTTKSKDHFAVFVIANADDMAINLSWKVSATFRLLSLAKNEVASKSFSNVIFDWTNSNWGFVDFLKWTDLMDQSKQFVKNNKAILEVELTVGEPIKND